MLKQLTTSLFALGLSVASVPFMPATATSTPIVIDNVLALCQNLLSHGSGLDESGTCDAYSGTQTSATINRIVHVYDDLVLQNLDLTFTRANAVFLMHGGRLTIDGGHYASPNCVVWIQYDNLNLPAHYVDTTTFTINSGVFEATVATTNSADSPSPVCVISPLPLTSTETQTVIAGYLPAGRRFVNMAPSLRTTKTATPTNDTIEADDGYAHISKDADEKTGVKYLKTTKVAVVGDDGQGGEPETPETPGTPETPETPDTPSETPVIPKAPNTGRAE